MPTRSDFFLWASAKEILFSVEVASLRHTNQRIEQSDRRYEGSNVSKEV